MRLPIIFSILLAGLSRVLADDASDVLSLTQDTFDSTVDPAELILVEFFAPWYTHSRKSFLSTCLQPFLQVRALQGASSPL